MRFLVKRPKPEYIREELTTVMEVMFSPIFIYLDLLLFSFIFALLLLPVFGSFGLALLFFAGSFSFFSSIYFLISSKNMKVN